MSNFKVDLVKLIIKNYKIVPKNRKVFLKRG